jgi:ribosome-binding factor A
MEASHHRPLLLLLCLLCASCEAAWRGAPCRQQLRWSPQSPQQRQQQQQQQQQQHRTPPPIMMAGDGRRRPSRVGNVVQAELARLIRSGDVHGKQRIPDGLNQLISIVDVDMSPDLRNARVKVSIIGDRKDKVTAVRWLRGNIKEIRHELAKRNRQMKRIPHLSFDHVDVGAATDMMVKLDELRREGLAAAHARGDVTDGMQPDVEGGIDFSVDDEDAWLDDDDDDDDDLFDEDEEEEDDDAA